jgi:hypothetical protein
MYTGYLVLGYVSFGSGRVVRNILMQRRNSGERKQYEVHGIMGIQYKIFLAT